MVGGLSGLSGFINLDKPQGWTSHDGVAKIRRWLKEKRVGHGGTLDPLATGVLPIAVGKATRLLPYLPTAKAYRAQIRFGLRTSTDDLEGDVIACQPTDRLTPEAVRCQLPQFLGEITQVPPVYSAIQVGGKRLYELARQGEAVTPPPRQVRIDRIDWIAWTPGDPAEVLLDIYCGPGTYIRSLARDLGKALGVGACLAGLRRTLSCGLSLDQSWSWEQLETHSPEGVILPPQTLLTHLPIARLTPPEIQYWQRGRAIPWGDRPLQEQPWVVLDDQEQCWGIGLLQENAAGPVLQPKMVLA